MKTHSYWFDAFAAATLLIGACGAADAQVNVTTYHNDNARTGQFTQETILTPANVNSTQFGKLFTTNVDGWVYAQPLYLSNVPIAGGTHNVMYVATEHDTLYAIDADSGVIYWHISLIAAGGTTMSSTTDLNCSDLVPEIGITGTPVIDANTGTIYLVAKSNVGGIIYQYLHAIDVATAIEKFGGPINIQASVPGTATDGNGTQLSFNSKNENQRPGLLLENGHVIIGWSSHCDISPWHGWIMSYSAQSLAQEAVYNTSPNGFFNGVWMSSSGLAADSSGNLYFATGNGSWNGTTDLGDSIVKLGPPSGGSFPTVDYFTPYNQSTLSGHDQDVSSGGVMLLPTLPSGRQLVVQMAKEGKIYVLDSGNMGKYCINQAPACTNSDPQIVQEIPNATPGVWGSPAYWNGNVYWGAGNDYSGVPDNIKAFSFNAGGSGLLSTTPTSKSVKTFGFSAPTPSISANGNTGGILWGVDNSTWYTGCSGGSNCQVLYAYDATNLATLLYSSAQASNNRDISGGAVKFATPIIANGKVYVGSQFAVSAYGLLSAVPVVAATPLLTPGSTSFTTTQSVTMSDTTPNATIYYTTDGSTPVPGTSSVYSTALLLSATTTVKAIAAAAGFTNSVVTSATYTLSSATTITPVNLSTGANVTAFSADGSPVPNGGIDGGGDAYSATLLGTNPTWSGVTFTLGAPGTLDGVSNKTLTLPAGNYSTLYMLATGVTGNQANQTLVVTYTDGTTSTFTQSFSDWFTPQNYTGESKALTQAYRLTSNGSADNRTFYVYGYSFALNSAKTVATLKLPATRNVVVLAISLQPGVPTTATPLLTPGSGSFTTTQSVSLSDTTANATIYYTTDGSTPVPGTSSVYSTSLLLSATTTVKALATAAGFANSALASATYTLATAPPAATPLLTPGSGNFTTTQSVSLSDTTATATIYYTTDGSTPVPETSSVYSTSLLLSATTTVKAIATAPGFTSSAVTSATYTLTSATTVTPVNLSSGANVTAFSTNGSPVPNGGVDGGGQAYSATLLGTNPTWSGVTFTLGAPGALDGVSNKTLTLPAGNYSTLYMLASGVNGNQANQTLVVTYTDGTTSTFTQSFSDWFTPQNYTGEAKALPQAYRLTSNGSADNRTFYVYGYSFVLNSAKTVASLKLPATRNVVVLAISLQPGVPTTAAPLLTPGSGNFTATQSVSVSDTTANATIYYTTDGSTPVPGTSSVYSTSLLLSATTTVKAIATAAGLANSAVTSATYTLVPPSTTTAVNLSTAANVTAFSNDGTPVPNGGIDAGGDAYSATLLGTSPIWSGVTFTLGTSGTLNGASNKTLTLPAGNFSTLYMLASGLVGNQANQTLIVTYTDGTTSSITQSFSDWFTPQNYTGEAKALTQAYRLTSSGSADNRTFYVYGYSFALNSAKTVQSLKLPATRNVVVLAITLKP